MTITLFDLAAAADPGLVRSEAICFELEHVLSCHNVHPVVGITAVTTLLIALLADCPPQHRTRLTENVLHDIRSNLLKANADHAA